MRKLCLILAAISCAAGMAYAGATYGGVYFEDGATSFADSVYSYTQGAGVSTDYDNSLAALGTPDYPASGSFVSLGTYGSLILQFTDNSLTTSGDAAADLHVFEIGGVIEWMNISISTNAQTWIDLGDLKGQPTSIDIDSVSGVTAGTKYSFVRILDIDPSQSGYPYNEADIDAVGAISSGAAVPVPGAMMLGGIGVGFVGWLRRRRTL